MLRNLIEAVVSRFSRNKKKKDIRQEFLLSKPLRNPEVEWSKAPSGEIGIKPLEMKDSSKKRKLKIIALDEMGSFIWELCNGESDVENIIHHLQEKYKVTRQEAELSISKFLSQLAQKNLMLFSVPELSDKDRAESSALEEMGIP